MGQFETFEETYDFEWDVEGRVPFYAQLASEAQGPVVEFACGTGRILMPIARRGAEVWGVERGGQLAARLGRRLMDEGGEVRSRVHFVEADPLTVDLGRSFALAFIAFGGLQLYVDDEQFGALVGNMARHVEPGGLLAADLFRLGRTRREHPGLVRHVWTMERSKFRETVSRFEVLLPANAPGALELTVFLDTVSETGQISRRVVKQQLRRLEPDELGPALARHGLVLESVYGSADLAPLDDDGERFFMVARRKS